MYININGNVIASCLAFTNPVYQEEAGEHRVEMTKAFAKCKESTPDGMQTVNLNLLFFNNLALPAMKIAAGTNLIIFGRESTKERLSYGKHSLERNVFVDSWFPRVIDPLNMLEELKVKRTLEAQKEEQKLMFAAMLTQCKPTIIQWVISALEGQQTENKSEWTERERGGK